MGKKHGFRGTPVRPSPIPSSVSGIFERRGDPLVSEREGREKFGRNLETENPDYDRYFAKLAVDLLKPEQIDKGNAFRKKVAEPKDPQREATNIVLSMRNKMRKHEPVEIKDQAKDATIACPYRCGFVAHDSRKVKQHLAETVRVRDKETHELKCKPKKAM